MSEVLTRITATRLVPVAVIPTVDDGLKLAEALLAGGLDVIEITLRTEAAEAAIAAIAKRFPQMLVGAGTLIDVDRIPALIDSGAAFAVSPGLNPAVVEAAMAAGLPITPGVITPGEVERARAMGLRMLKFFPAEAAGGVPMLKALAGPYGHTGIKFIPTGGIDAKKAQSYWALPTVAAVGGSWFVSPDLVKAGRFDEITALTREALSLIPQ